MLYLYGVIEPEEVQNPKPRSFQNSKRYSDDSEDSLDSDALLTPRHKQEKKILSEEKKNGHLLMSSATDEDSDEDVVLILTQS